MSAEQHVTAWGPPPATPPKPRQASMWGVVLGYLGILFLPSLILLPVAIYLAVRQDNTTDPETLSRNAENILSDSGPLIVSALILQWAILLLSVWLSSRKLEGGWRALTKWGFRWRQDLLIAVGFAATFVVLQAIVAATMQAFGIDVSKLGNVNIITSMSGVWLAVIAAAAVIGAPLVEEIFFRGFFFTVASRKWGTTIGVIVSSVFFGLLHVQPTLAASIYTITATSIVGAALAVLYARTGRLGTPLLAHVAFNASAVALTLLLAR